MVEPPCDPDTKAPMLLCPETCRAFDKLISSSVCDSYFAEIIRTLENSTTLANHFRLFNCSDPATYFQNSRAEVCDSSSVSCTNLFSPATQSKCFYMIHIYVYYYTIFFPVESIFSKDSLFRCVNDTAYCSLLINIHYLTAVSLCLGLFVKHGSPESSTMPYKSLAEQIKRRISLTFWQTFLHPWMSCASSG